MKDPEITKLLKNATELASSGDIKKAISELERAAEIEPNDGDIYNQLGDLYIKLKKKNEAIDTYKKGIDAYQKDGYLRNSLALCKKLLRYDPGNKDIYPVMGKLLVGVDAKIDAMTYLFEYIETQKEKEDFKKVIETLDYMRELGVKDRSIIERMMEIYKSVGRADRAELLTEPKAEKETTGETKLVFDRTIKVLLIEDDEDDYIITRDMLAESREIKFKLEWSRTCSAGLEYLCSKEFDVCLLDYHLGERTGLELLRDAIEKGCTIPVILLTGHSGREVDLEAMYAGAADYLVKGQVDATSLERSIRYAIERNALLNALRESQEKLRAQLVRTVALSDALNEKQKDLEKQVIHDDLTSLFNRRHFKVIMGLAVSAAKREGKPLSLCIGDIDNFKEINDQNGHQVGDEVLKTFANIIKENVGAKDSIARYGGDEICILFPNAKAKDIVKIVEDIRNQLARTGFEGEGKNRIDAKASFGIAEFTGKENQRELFRLADKALYEAKATGRNRIVIK